VPVSPVPPARRSHAPSAHDVARLAGVSQAAVSRAFTPGASIAETTRAKVFTAAKTLGYRPNLLARSLITGRSGIVGVVIGRTRNPFFLDALDALSERLSRAGQHLLMFTAGGNGDADLLVEDLLKYRVDALLLMSASLSEGLAERCRDESIPVIFFSRRPRVTSGFASVTGANRAGATAIACHLVERGYRAPAFIAGLESSSTSRERESAFSEALRAQSVPLIARAAGDYDRQATWEATRTLLSLTPRPDAIFCANDFMAFAAIDCARHDFGLEIGRQLGIAGFDDLEGAAWSTWSLTSYSQPVHEMVDRAMDILLDTDRPADPPHFVVEGELKVRDSTRRE
jgi:DNA-binding LacI/PurR family transcriptional regulator